MNVGCRFQLLRSLQNLDLLGGLDRLTMILLLAAHIWRRLTKKIDQWRPHFLWLQEATAEGERLKAVALNTPGGENLVALETVEQLNFSWMNISTQKEDFLDVETFLKKIGAKAD